MDNSIVNLINVVENLDTIKQALENMTVDDLDSSRIQLVSLIEDTREVLSNV
ncbi:hypothetical protein ACFHWD_03785 [Clostridium sp. MT-14]|uniref:hypothetical protein n=1 Tax=Clostridium sp. MT-14 TaxID=3348360 RepID=UPI0035F40BF4